MKKYKIIKKRVSREVFDEVEEKMPMWYFRFLLWLFGPEEERLRTIIADDERYAWDKAFSMATDKAHSYKEAAMEKKLYELGFRVECNFPMARKLNPNDAPTVAIDPKKSWDIVPINPSN